MLVISDEQILVNTMDHATVGELLMNELETSIERIPGTCMHSSFVHTTLRINKYLANVRITFIIRTNCDQETLWHTVQ